MFSCFAKPNQGLLQLLLRIYFLPINFLISGITYYCAMAKIEREHFLKQLPAAYAALFEDIPDEEIRAAIVRKERAALKA